MKRDCALKLPVSCNGLHHGVGTTRVPARDAVLSPRLRVSHMTLPESLFVLTCLVALLRFRCFATGCMGCIYWAASGSCAPARTAWPSPRPSASTAARSSRCTAGQELQRSGRPPCVSSLGVFPRSLQVLAVSWSYLLSLCNHYSCLASTQGVISPQDSQHHQKRAAREL